MVNSPLLGLISRGGSFGGGRIPMKYMELIELIDPVAPVEFFRTQVCRVITFYLRNPQVNLPG